VASPVVVNQLSMNLRRRSVCMAPLHLQLISTVSELSSSIVTVSVVVLEIAPVGANLFREGGLPTSPSGGRARKADGRP